jgi:hypothetical protein
MSIYTNTARFDGTARALTEEQLFKLAPSIFATTAHDSRSDRFAPIPTIEIVRGLAREGFSVVGAMQSGSREVSKQDFTKHLLRIRRLDDDTKHSVGDNVLEMLLQNGNDGSSAYKLMAGMFRIRCLNSLVSQTSTVDEVKIRHSGDALGKVIEGTYSVLQSAEKLLAAPQDWSQIKLSDDVRRAFAVGAHVERFADHEGNINTAVKPEQLLIPRRADDRANDLWTTFNVIQENAMRGGITAIGRDANNRRRRTTTREIGGIDQNVKLNKGLWAMAEYLADNRHQFAA